MEPEFMYSKVDDCIYYRPTNLFLLPLLISAVSLVYKQNYVQLNLNSPTPLVCTATT
jgi:hypothetical protein